DPWSGNSKGPRKDGHPCNRRHPPLAYHACFHLTTASSSIRHPFTATPRSLCAPRSTRNAATERLLSTMVKRKPLRSITASPTPLVIAPSRPLRPCNAPPGLAYGESCSPPARRRWLTRRPAKGWWSHDHPALFVPHRPEPAAATSERPWTRAPRGRAG